MGLSNSYTKKVKTDELKSYIYLSKAGSEIADKWNELCGNLYKTSIK